MNMTVRKKAESKPDQDRHERKCTICNHLHRDEIEQAYLEWEAVGEICQQHQVIERALYRHIKALELDLQKITNRRRFYLKVMERASLDDVSPTEALMAGKLLEQIDGRINEGINIHLTQEERDKEYAKIVALVRKTETDMLSFATAKNKLNEEEK